MINVGIIGIGYWGPNLVRNFIRNDNAKVKIVSDLKQGRLDFIKSQYPDISVTNDAFEIINDTGIDAVAIATPVITHFELAKKCLESGKHVFLEKPFTYTYNEGVELVKLAKNKNKIIAVGHIFQFAPAVSCIKENIDSGLLGSVYHLTSQRINLGPPKTTVDVLWDLGPHDLSILLHLFNEFPEKIEATGNSYWWDGIIDNCHLNLKFPSGKSAHIHLSWLSSNKTRVTQIFGENGNIVYDETKPDEEKVIFYDKGIDNRIDAKDNEVKNLQYGKGIVKNLEVKKGEPLFLEIDAFIKSIMNNIPPINDGKIGCEVIRILEEASKIMKG
jgi:predicted dehydrogenase